MKRVLIGIVVLFLAANFLLILAPSLIESENDAFFTYFYLHNVNMNISYSICFVMVFSWAIIEPYYAMASTKFDRQCIVRIGYSKFYRLCIKEIVLKSLCFRIILEVLIFLSIVLLGATITLSYDPTFVQHVVAFHSELLINYFLYVLFSAIGTAVLGVFMFSLIDSIKNKYVFRVIIAIILLVTVVLSAVLMPLIHGVMDNLIENDRILRTVVSFLIPLSLIEPGAMWSSYGILNLLISAIFYTGLSVIFMKTNLKRRSIYG